MAPLARRFSRLSWQLWPSWPAALVGLLLSVGCAPSSAYVRAEVPVAIETYPRAYHAGHYYYWGGDRWYVHHNGVWFYYPTEPAYLYRFRARWHGHYARPPRVLAPHRHYTRPYHAPYRHAAPPARRPAPAARRR